MKIRSKTNILILKQKMNWYQYEKSKLFIEKNFRESQ